MITTRYFGVSKSPLENVLVEKFVSGIIWGKQNCVRDYCSMAVYDGDEMIAGVLYHNWYQNRGIIELTGASKSKKWFSKRVINSMMNVPFNILNCQLALVKISEKRESALKLARTFGCSEYFVPRLCGRDEGEYIFTYTDDQWNNSIFRDKK